MKGMEVNFEIEKGVVFKVCCFFRRLRVGLRFFTFWFFLGFYRVFELGVFIVFKKF